MANILSTVSTHCVMKIHSNNKAAEEACVERIAERRIIVICLDQLKTETDPIKRDVLEMLLIAEVDKKARLYIGPVTKFSRT